MLLFFVGSCGSGVVLSGSSSAWCSQFAVAFGVSAVAARAEQLMERASELGGERRVQYEVRRTVDHHQRVGHGRRQPEIDLLPWSS